MDRIDLFGTGKVIGDYYKHRRIEFRIKDLKVAVAKPYGACIKHYAGFRTFETPSIRLSSNVTATMEFSDIQLLNAAITRAIDILNSENDGLIIDTRFSLGREIDYERQVPDNIKRIHKMK